MEVTMYKKIIFASDGSDNAHRAGLAAIELVKDLSLKSITVIHIATSPPAQSRMIKADFDTHTLLEEDAKDLMKGTFEEINNAGLSVEIKVAIGDPADEIVRITEKEKADLLVIGSRGLGSITGVLIGSVSQKIVHEVSCPVMIVK